MLSTTVLAYPIIISQEGTDHQKNKELIYSIPKNNFKYVEIVEFRSKPIKHNNKIYQGYAYVYWDYYHNCYKGKIEIYNYIILSHELGHIYDLCVRKNNKTTEEFANGFNLWK